MSDIVTMISTLGFPIVCAVILAYVVKYMFDRYTTDINRLTDTHNQESKEFADALNKNTAILNKVASILHDLVMKIDNEKEIKDEVRRVGDETDKTA